MAQYDVVVKAVDQTKVAFRGVEAGLKSIDDRAQRVNRSMAGLSTGITAFGVAAVAALGAATRSAITFANEVDDIANATDISAQAINGFAAAVQDAGGNSQKALDSILKLNQNISEAAGGSDSLRKSFADVGVSLNDLANLSAEDLLGRVVTGLGQIDDKSKQAAVAAELLGKGFKGVSASLVAANIGKFTQDAAGAAAAQKSIADATAVVEQAFGRLRNRITEAIKPLADYVNALKPEQIDRFINALIGLTGAIVGLTVGVKIFQSLATAATLAGAAFAAFALGAGRLATAFTNQLFRLKAGFAAIAAGVGVATGATESFSMKVGGKLTTVATRADAVGFTFKRLGQTLLLFATRFIPALIGALLPLTAGFAGIVGVAGLVATAIDAIFDTKIIDTFVSGVKSAYNGLKNLLGLGGGAPAGISQEESDNEIQRIKNRAAAAQAAAAGVKGPVRAVPNKELEAFNESIAKTREEYKLFQTLLNSSDPAVAAAALEKVTSAAKTLQLVLSDDLILRNYYQAQKDIAEALRQQNIIYSDSARVLGEFNLELAQQEAELRKSATVIGDTATQQRQFNIELVKSQQAQQQQAITLGLASAAYRDGKISLDDYLKTLQSVDAALLTAEQRQLQFNEAISKGMADTALTAQMAGQAMAEAFATGDMERYLQIYEQYKNVLGTTATGELAQARKGAKDELQTMRDRTAALRTLTEEYKANGGTGSAEYRKVAEALGMSTDAIDRMVTVHGSAIDRMVEDARFYEQSIGNAATTFSSEFTRAFMEGRNALDSFRNFFSNIANDIANRIIKQQLADPIADALSGIVGKVIGGMGSGGGSGGGGFFSSIISGVGGFLGDIFGGFFADGGTLGAGQFGVVGEEGPELITGPANITPMNDMKSAEGSLQVVFQIQAIDTQTGAQFLLQNKPLITSMITQAYNSRGRRGPLD